MDRGHATVRRELRNDEEEKEERKIEAMLMLEIILGSRGRIWNVGERIIA